jgi:hypothetical protein
MEGPWMLYNIPIQDLGCIKTERVVAPIGAHWNTIMEEYIILK